MALRPDADVTVNGWRNESGGTTLYASLNETSANDANYIQSASNPSPSDYFEVGLSNPTGTPTNGPFKYRIFKKLNNAAVVNMKVALMQGSTEIASWTHNDISNTPTEYSQTLTGPQFSAITDFTDLRIRGIPNPAPAGAEFWRIYVLGVVNSGSVTGVGANLLEFRIGGVGQAPAAFSASSDLGLGFTADLSYDGDMSTRWASDFSNTWPQWLAHHLGSPKAIDSMRLVGNSDGNGPSDFEIHKDTVSTFATYVVAKTVSGLTTTDWTGVNYIGGTGLGLTFSIP